MFLFTTIFIMMLVGAELDLFVPSFPELQEVFNLSTFMVELTLTVNLIAHCIAAFLAGSLGDKYGRRPVIITGLIIFIIGSVVCVIADSYSVLIIGRVIQGIGISGPSVLMCALLSDLYSVNRMQHLLGIVNGVVTIAMACAPVVGSYVNLFFNWRGNFLVLLILGILSLILIILCIPKTQHIHAKPDINLSIKDYLPIFKSEKAVFYLIFLCFSVQSYWVFIGMSPILYMHDLGVDLKNFGLYQGVIAAAFAIVSLSSGYFLKKLGVRRCFMIGGGILTIFFVLVLTLVVLDTRNPVFITITMMFQALGMVYPLNILWPLALESVENAKGKIGALLTSGKFILSAIAISISSYFYDGRFFVIGITILTTLFISAISCYLLFKKHKVLQPI